MLVAMNILHLMLVGAFPSWNISPVMGELPSLLGTVQTSCTDLGGPGRRTVVLPRKPWGSLQGCLYQANMACYHVTDKEVGMYQEEMWIWQHRSGHYQNSRRNVELLWKTGIALPEIGMKMIECNDARWYTLALSNISWKPKKNSWEMIITKLLQSKTHKLPLLTSFGQAMASLKTNA